MYTAYHAVCRDGIHFYLNYSGLATIESLYDTIYFYLTELITNTEYLSE